MAQQLDNYLAELQASDLGVWVIDRDFTIVDATASVAEALQVDLKHLVGSSILDSDPIISVSAEARIARLQRVFHTGQADTMVFWQKLHRRGWSRIISTASLLGSELILNVAHDITETEDSLLWIRSDIFQRLPVLIADADGQCLVATDGIAALCGYADGESLTGKSVLDTPFAVHVDQERNLVAMSREQQRPIHSLEWALDTSGLHQYVITRIALDQGRMMLIMQDITGTVPFLSAPASVLSQAVNVEPHLTPRQFDILRAWWHGEPRQKTASRLGIKEGTVDYHRDLLKQRFGVPYPKDVITALRGTLLAAILDQHPL